MRSMYVYIYVSYADYINIYTYMIKFWDIAPLVTQDSVLCGLHYLMGRGTRANYSKSIYIIALIMLITLFDYSRNNYYILVHNCRRDIKAIKPRLWIRVNPFVHGRFSRPILNAPYSPPITHIEQKSSFWIFSINFFRNELQSPYLPYFDTQLSILLYFNWGL